MFRQPDFGGQPIVAKLGSEKRWQGAGIEIFKALQMTFRVPSTMQ